MARIRAMAIVLSIAFLTAGGCTSTGGNETSPETVSVVRKALSGDGISADLTINSDWTTGYVAQIVVRNTGTQPTTSWTVEVDLRQSTLSGSPWAAVASQAGANLLFTAESYNAVLAPGATATFGFQGTATTAAQRPVIVAVRRSTAGGTGGAPGTGGSKATGGNAATGGALATGGSKTTGGNTGTGGNPSIGGSEATGGAAPTGGKAATGGNSAAGGISATGGVWNNAGGSTAIGGTGAAGGGPVD